MSNNKKTEWTIIETFEEDDFICIDFYERAKKGNNTSDYKFGNPKVKYEPNFDKKRNSLLSLKNEEYYLEWDKYISKYRKSIYNEEIENLQNQLKELKIVESNIERDLDYNKRNEKKFKESQNKYVENQIKIKEVDKNINNLLQDIYKLNQLKDIGKDLLGNKISFGLFDVDFKTLQNLPADFVAFPAFLVEYNHRSDSISNTKGDLKYLDSLPQGIKDDRIKDDIIKSANKYNIKYTIDLFNKYEKIHRAN
ncbi:hypothetical protein RhiirA5_456661 [Rhizophagus irregularis]|uniref:Uncharacterized protein n=1 Tax=Rhizophagus irregularis TaxID=588596 RepID=A0A2N0Q4B8_9GLOM|nr:hypothetical protein RhiirA5_456661 [Rhizophagus irregularis]CAB4496095.1 unnamed protein product [Rhizophagus irregularis]CAB5396201.1 unnamed protein product [Rhizophagus irregularis]